MQTYINLPTFWRNILVSPPEDGSSFFPEISINFCLTERRLVPEGGNLQHITYLVLQGLTKVEFVLTFNVPVQFANTVGCLF